MSKGILLLVSKQYCLYSERYNRKNSLETYIWLSS